MDDERNGFREGVDGGTSTGEFIGDPGAGRVRRDGG